MEDDEDEDDESIKKKKETKTQSGYLSYNMIVKEFPSHHFHPTTRISDK